MKKITLILFILLYTHSFSQNYISGFIFDKSTNKSLPYATIKLISDQDYYTISNEDGKFEINKRAPSDSLEIRFLGFQTKTISSSYFDNNIKLFLSPNPINLDEITLNSDKNYAYNLLFDLVKKYRKKQTITQSKSFLKLSSSARGIPIEQLEGFYNSEQSLAKGVIDLKIKSGRFGQNKSFPFYSLNNTDILKDFQFFQSNNQILPLQPGNMTYSELKGRYKVKIDQCDNCSINDMVISFVPKKMNGRLFFGKILFDCEKLIIKKINLEINDPVTKKLSSIVKNDAIKPKNINLSILFNPSNFNQIQTINFNFVIYYKSKSVSEIINSSTFIYFYEFNSPFQTPYFTKSIKFNNDYDKIIALQATNDFWNTNYQFPKSFKDDKAINFLKKYGYLINFQNSIPNSYIEHIQPSVISWNKNKKIGWESIKNNIQKNKIEKDHSNHIENTTHVVDEVTLSATDLRKKDRATSSSKKFNFSYILDSYLDKNGELKYISRTVFNRNSSFYMDSRSKNKLLYLSLIFDIYEVFNRTLKKQLSNKTTFEDAKKLCDSKFEEASVVVNKMKNQTHSGSNYQSLIKWNNSVKKKITINN
jgi:CarboxypepD_reg-like domain